MLVVAIVERFNRKQIRREHRCCATLKIASNLLAGSKG